MPEIKNTFIKSKMNKDLDARLLPNGEYRDAKNVSISRSEGSDVGALENVLGNRKLTSLRANLGYLEDAKIIARAPNAPISGDVVLNGLEIIGYYMDVTNDRIFLFLTDYSDASNDRLSNFAPADITYQYQPPGDPPPAPETAFSAKGAACYIVQYNVSNNQYRVLVGGNFLNFSKTHPIINVNMIENMLFWTDNRNQPRKINIDFANNDSYELSGANNPYYYNEDHISVAKFAPFESPSFLDTSNESGLLNVSTEFLPSHIINTLSSNTGSGGSTFNLNGGPYSIIGDNPDLKQGDKIIFPVQLDLSTPITSPLEYIISTPGANSVTISGTADQDIVLGAVFEIARANPIYDSNYKGDENLIKDKFIRFSYRFKYDDGEYSLMAPFTQAAFIPDQFGHFINDDETITAESTDVKFMENSVSKVKLNIKLPSMALLLKEKFKVKEIQILAKNSDELAVKVIENVPVSKLSSNNTVNYIYEYLSSKPIKNLPEADLIRVSDQIPIRALTQEVSGNRLIYGNFVNKHATPDYLEYDIKYKEKLDNNFTVEFPNHTVKQNRSYQVGVVLYDRYGRASNVILSDPDLIGANFSNSTVYARYSNFGTNSINYWGDYLEFSLKNPIPNSGKQGYPGLYSETNPLGYYTYRIVVKQQEQEYYNVYAPGALAGELLWDTKPDWKNSGSVDFINDVLANINDYLPRFIDTNRVSMISLFGDNINKVPRELRTSTNANDTTFGSETILFNRINPIYDSTNGSYNKQSSVSKRGEKVISIEPFKDLGAWTTTKGNGFPFGSSDPNLPPQPFYPYFVSNEGGGVYKLHYHDIFFNSQANPFIATIETDFKIGATPEYRSTQQNSDFEKADAKLRIERAWQDLSVFETSPVKSNIEIYYETSSSGLISDLNEDVGTDGPFSLRDASGNDTATGSLQWILSENDAIGSPATLYFEAFDASGSACADSNNTMSIVSVVDGSNPTNDRSSDFIIEQQSASSYNFRIKSNTLFMYGENANTLESYTFVIRVTANNITNDITLNNCRLINDPPVISNIFTHGSSLPYNLSSLPILPDQIYLYNGPISTTNVQNIEILRFTAKNGSADTARDTEQISATVVDLNNQPHPYLFIDNIRAGGTQLASNEFVIHPDANAINQILTQQGQQLTTYFRVKVYDSNETSVPAGLTDFNRTITFEKS